MIKIIDGDVTNCKEMYIMHQVNTFGASGAGVAKYIKIRFPQAVKEYATLCKANISNYEDLYGIIHISQLNNHKKIISLFSQRDWSTDYYLLEKCLLKVKDLFEVYAGTGFSIAMPYKMSCGLAGGDWDNVVYPMIERILKDCNIVIYKYNQ